MSDAGDPIVPAFVDLRDFAFMPLKVLRLRDSDLATYSSGDEFKAAVLLWCAAWHQVPAGTLPNDDKWLAKHSGVGLGWKKIRPGALRGWTVRSDGRLHHEVLAEVAVDSWNKKVEQRLKTIKARIAKQQKACDSATQPVDKRSATEAMECLLQDMSQLQGMTVTAPVTVAKTPPREVKVSEVKVSLKPAVELNPDIPPHANGSQGRIEKPLNGNPAESWSTSAWVNATAKTLGIERRNGECDEDFADRVHTEVDARRRKAKTEARRHA